MADYDELKHRVEKLETLVDLLGEMLENSVTSMSTDPYEHQELRRQLGAERRNVV